MGGVCSCASAEKTLEDFKNAVRNHSKDGARKTLIKMLDDSSGKNARQEFNRRFNTPLEEEFGVDTVIHIVIKKHRLFDVKDLVPLTNREEADFTRVGRQGLTPLMCASHIRTDSTWTEMVLDKGNYNPHQLIHGPDCEPDEPNSTLEFCICGEKPDNLRILMDQIQWRDDEIIAALLYMGSWKCDKAAEYFTLILNLCLRPEVAINSCAYGAARDSPLLHWTASESRNDIFDAVLDFSAAELNTKRECDQRNALHMAVIAGNDHATRLLLQHGVSIEDVDDEGNTPLHLACLHAERPGVCAEPEGADDDHSVMTTLLEFGASSVKNERNRAGQTCISIIESKRGVLDEDVYNDVTTQLASSNSDASKVNSIRNWLRMPFDVRLKKLHQLVEEDTDGELVNTELKGRQRLIHILVSEPKFKVSELSLLIQHPKLDLNACGENDYTPLMLAVLHNRDNLILETLCARGARPYAKEVLQRKDLDHKRLITNALQCAVRNKSHNHLQILLENYTFPTACFLHTLIWCVENHAGWTDQCLNKILTHAEDDLGWVNAAVFDDNDPEKTGKYTLLMKAATSQQAGIVKQLIKVQALDDRLVSKEGLTALHMALRGDASDTIQLLAKTARPPLDILDPEGNTPMHLACGRVDEVEMRHEFLAVEPTPSALLKRCTKTILRHKNDEGKDCMAMMQDALRRAAETAQHEEDLEVKEFIEEFKQFAKQLPEGEPLSTDAKEVQLRV